MEGLFIAASGGAKQTKKLEVLSNNLANVATQSFKRSLLMVEERIPPFQESANPFHGFPFRGTSSRDPAVAYVEATRTLTDYSSGSLINTGNPLDVALEGDGFYVLETPEGPRYTRNGTFHLDGVGQLVDREGNIILSRNDEPILIPINTDQITINQDGTIYGGRGLETFPLAQIKIVQFEDNSGLQKEGEGMYVNKSTRIKKQTQNDTRVMQGFMEKSNVNAVHEMTRMIETVRTLEAYQKIIQSIDEADDQSVNNLGRVA